MLFRSVNVSFSPAPKASESPPDVLTGTQDVFPYPFFSRAPEATRARNEKAIIGVKSLIAYIIDDFLRGITIHHSGQTRPEARQTAPSFRPEAGHHHSWQSLQAAYQPD